MNDEGCQRAQDGQTLVFVGVVSTRNKMQGRRKILGIGGICCREGEVSGQSQKTRRLFENLY